jgi:uncharacterized protein
VHVLVTGATGLVGTALTHSLLRRGDMVTALSRSPQAPRLLPAGVRHLAGDPASPGPWEEELARADACVHLAGEPIGAGRWTAARKERIRRSRVDSTARVAAVIRGGGPAVLVSASAVGLYGDRGDELLDEASAPGKGFLSEVVREWEAAAEPARARPHVRVVAVRSGIVLARGGGALPRMALPFRLLAGGTLGRATAWRPWIHLADEVGLILLALDDARVDGPLVAAAPNPVTSRELARSLGKVLHRPALVPAPAFALRLALGELAGDLLASQRATPRKARALGYRFRFPELELALRDLFR